MYGWCSPIRFLDEIVVVAVTCIIFSATQNSKWTVSVPAYLPSISVHGFYTYDTQIENWQYVNWKYYKFFIFIDCWLSLSRYLAFKTRVFMSTIEYEIKFCFCFHIWFQLYHFYFVDVQKKMSNAQTVYLTPWKPVSARLTWIFITITYFIYFCMATNFPGFYIYMLWTVFVILFYSVAKKFQFEIRVDWKFTRKIHFPIHFNPMRF